MTIVYQLEGQPGTAPTLWQLVSGQVARITVRATLHAIPTSLRGRNFRSDPDFRKELQAWVTRLWQAKDAQIGRLAA